MASMEEQIRKADFSGVLVTAIVAGLAFVVGLFWRDAIVETINRIVPQGDTLTFRYISAIVATIIVIILAYILVKLQQIHIRHVVRGAKRGGKKAQDIQEK